MRSLPCTSSPAIAASALPAPAASVARYSPTGHPSVRCMSSPEGRRVEHQLRGVQQLPGLVLVHGQIVGRHLDHLAPGPQLGHRDRRLGARGEPEPRARGQPERQLGDGVAAAGVLDRLDVVEGHRERRPHRRCGDRQTVPAGGEVDAAGRGQRPEDRRLHGLQAVECGGEVAEERPGVVVPRVQADPGLPRLAGFHPLAEQGRLPVPGRSDHGDDRGVGGEQPPDQGGAGHESGPAPRRAQLGLEQLRFQPERRHAPPRGRAKRPSGRAGRHGHGG